MTDGQSKLLEEGKEYYHKLKDSNIARDVFDYFKLIVDSSINEIFAKDIRETYLKLNVELTCVRCAIFSRRCFEIGDSWTWRPFVYVEKKHKNPDNFSQVYGLKLVLAEKFEHYLRTHNLVFQVLNWDMPYGEPEIIISFTVKPNDELSKW